MATNKYNDNVFINCPFDESFTPLFRAFTFAVLDCGFIPRCSLELDNATDFRLEAIIKLIRDCRYGIHDISRVELDTKSMLPRFNMPFELGIFYSAKHYGGTPHKNKHCIILEKYKYRYHKYISDIAGIDVTPHKNSEKECILAIRNWLLTSSKRSTIPDGNKINTRYKQFKSDLKKVCNKSGRDYNSMPFVEITRNMSDWLRINQLVHEPLFS